MLSQGFHARPANMSSMRGMARHGLRHMQDAWLKAVVRDCAARPTQYIKDAGRAAALPPRHHQPQVQGELARRAAGR